MDELIIELLEWIKDTVGLDNAFMRSWLKRYEAQRQIQNTERMTG